MDRLNQLRGAAGDSTLDTTSPPSESYMTANESTSKYFSLSEVDSSFDISPIKDVSLASATADSESTITEDGLIPNLSPIRKKNDILDSYKIGKQIEAANILSGGVDIFDDNDNSYDGDELVIDDNIELDEKSNSEIKQETVDFKSDMIESTLIEGEADVASKDTEVVLQIDGKNVDAIDIGNGLYLYRKDGEEELAAVQIIDDEKQQPSFKFLKVRENTEGNLEVYEEIEVEIQKEVPAREGTDINTPHVPIRDINKVINDTTSNKVDKNKTLQIEQTSSICDVDNEYNKDVLESKSEVNLNGKMVKFNESRKSPVIGSFAYHSTPNKEGKPLTKTMVDLQLHPSRHSDNIKKTIEVHTDNCKQKMIENQIKHKDFIEEKEPYTLPAENDATTMLIDEKSEENINNGNEVIKSDNLSLENNVINTLNTIDVTISKGNEPAEITKQHDQQNVPVEVKNKTLEPEKLVTFDKGVVLDTGNSNMPQCYDQVENTMKNHKHIEQDDSEVNISKIDISHENILSNQSSEEANKKSETHIKCNSTDSSQGILCSLDEQSQNNKGQDNKIAQIKDHIVGDKVVSNENNSLDIAEKSSVPKHFETMNIHKDLKENNILKNITEDRIECSKAFREDSEFKNEIAKEMDKDINREENNKNTLDQYIEESNVCNNQNIKSIPLSNKSTLSVQFDIHNENSDTKKSLPFNSTEKSVQSQEKSPCEQKHLVNKSDESNISTVEKSSNDCKNIIQSKGDILIEDKEVNIKKGQDKLLDDKVIEMENFKTEHISEIKPLKNREESEVPIQIETKLESESNENQKDIKIIDDESKSISTGSAVPFGKWTEANRQEFLNKIKGTRTLVNNSNNKAIKNSNDLNRRDVLKKIASKRHTSTISKTQDLCTTNSTKPETVFTSKPVIPVEELNAVPKIPNAIASHESKIPLKVGTSTSKTNEVTIKKSTKPDSIRKPLAIPTKVTSTVTSITKKESVQRKAVKDLIDKTIEGMIIKAFPSKPTSTETKASDSNVVNTSTTSTTLDAIEMKMNELHGIPFIERPPHELPKVNNPVPQNYVPADQEKISDIKPTKVPKLLSSNNKDTQELVNVNTLEVDSEEEVIEHEPVTGDIEIKHDLPSNLSINESSIKAETHNLNKDNTKKEPVITEKDFDKFARRNSVSYENCLTVSFDKQEPLNVVKAVIEMDIAPKNHNKNEVLKIESKPHHASKIQNLNLNKHPNKIYSSTKIGRAIEDPSNKHYHSKLQIAYQSALTAKRQLSCPIDIIEDQPVKVVFMDAKTDFVPNILNIQGQELSSSEKKNAEEDTIHATDSLNSDLVNAVDEEKPQEDIKVKTKHQRKQVLTPVETPELELIEPRDLGIDVSPKKKRKTEDNKADKNSKNVIHKKSYLLGRSVVEDKILKTQNLTNNESKSTLNIHEEIVPKDAVTAIDSLVKAAEMLENQSENMNSSTTSNSDSLPSTTPVKRGRGRPRKYPLPDVTTDKPKVPSPQKKPRLIDAKQNKRDTEDEESSDEAAVKENWTMGKINENIVCPICNKLFRSENVIFKHVKHCSGPSPNRSDTSTRSARKGRSSQESDDKSHGSQDEMYVDDEKTYEDNEDMITERKCEDTINKSDEDNNVIVIEDRPEKSKKHSDEKQCESRLGIKNRIQNTSSSNLECEFCGKTFRQLSYLVNHKLQHKKENIKKIEKSEIGNKSVLSCDICYKGFRKLHHLAQHRIIHNQNSTPNKMLRKNSSEQIIYTTEKEETSKQSEDPSAGFRCEPCDKSFRKLHHLVEHRETHDGINRQKTSCPEQNTIDKTIPPPQCDICKKTFRKLHHLIEHKEQHVETSSEKSDDKSVKSSLSTKDIIHECSLCYMVFPNEHSLNKHTIICQRKKRLSKQPKQVNEGEPDNIETDNFKIEEDKIDDGDEPEIILDEVKVINLEKDDDDIDMFTADVVIQEEHTHLPNITDNQPPNVVEDKKIENQKEHDNVTEVIVPKIEHFVEIKDKKDKTEANEIERVQDNLKKKTNIHKDKMVPTVTKRPKKISVGLKTVDENKPLEAISDDDEVRYMLNPDYKPEDTSDDKLFLKVKAKKRNSLQIERPNSKDLIKRRTSLQHPPKIPRLKSKPIENKIVTTSTALIKNIPKNTKVKPNPSTDSDDSDVKYSFPVKLPKPTHEKSLKDTEKRTLRKSLEEKRKSLSGIAKRKSLGKSIAAAPPKVQQQSSVKQVKRRTRDVEHRCDCGQLFSSAALLSRHTSLAHTPPRIRKRRSPPPDTDNKTLIKRAPRKSSDTTKQTVVARKPSVRSDASSSLPKPNRSAKATTEPKLSEVRKSIKPTEKEIELSKTGNTSKLRRSGAHRGVPVPEKMRNLYQRGGKK